MNVSKQMLVAASVVGIMAAAGVLSAGHSKAEAEGETTKVPCYGINTCHGVGECGGKGHSCAGKNGCEGQGFLSLSKDTCLKIKGGRLTSEGTS